MKTLFFIVLSILSTQALADYSEANILKKNQEKGFAQKIGLNFELVTELQQNRERDVVGTNNFLETNLTYNMNRNNRFVMANGFTGIVREDQPTNYTYDYIQFEYNRKNLMTDSKDGLDLWAHGRFSYTTNDELRERYGSYGLAEGRLYFGKKLFGNFSINKYISYIRLQKYFVRGDSPYSRNFGWRTMVSPSYKIMGGLEASLIMTYSGYKLQNDSVDQEFELNPSVRYQFGKVALIFSAEFKPYDTKDGEFKYIEDFELTPKWATILSFYAF